MKKGAVRLGVIGAGDLGQLLAHHAPACGDFEIAGFFDDTREVGAATPGGMVLGGIDSLLTQDWTGRLDGLVVGIGYRHRQLRQDVFRRLCARYAFPALVHASCYVDASASVGDGAVLLPGCVLDAGVRIGGNVLLNTGCVIAHDTIVEEGSFLSPAVALAGFVHVGGCCFLGIGTRVIDNVRIEPWTRTGGGAVVTRDLTQPGLYVGVPARLVREQECPLPDRSATD